MVHKKGRFITLEGSEGSGKTTAMQYIRQLLKQRGLTVIQTREPGGTLIAEKIRTLLLDPENHNLAEDAELLLMFAARSQHINELILPALQQGKWVISDRFVDASFAYQGGARGLGFERVRQLSDWCLKDCYPDLTLLFDLPVELGMQRARKRAELDRFENQKIDFFEKVRQSYLQLAELSPERIKCLDASQDISAVQEQIAQLILPFLDEQYDEK